MFAENVHKGRDWVGWDSAHWFGTGLIKQCSLWDEWMSDS